MIKGFDYEEFISQPISIDITQEMQYARRGNTIAAFPTERSIMINIGGKDYDVKDLIWRLERAEAATYDLQALCAQLFHRIEELEQDRFKIRF